LVPNKCLVNTNTDKQCATTTSCLTDHPQHVCLPCIALVCTALHCPALPCTALQSLPMQVAQASGTSKTDK